MVMTVQTYGNIPYEGFALPFIVCLCGIVERCVMKIQAEKKEKKKQANISQTHEYSISQAHELVHYLKMYSCHNLSMANDGSFSFHTFVS